MTLFRDQNDKRVPALHKGGTRVPMRNHNWSRDKEAQVSLSRAEDDW